MIFLIAFTAFLWAGIQNALAGGGSFITLPVLMLTGLSPRAANITSTIALFPAQIATGWTGREFVSGAAGVSFRALAMISLIGGALGAVLLLVTPQSFFARLIPWLVLFATIVFAWGNFGPRRHGSRSLGRFGAAFTQFCIAVYGGYFGGAIGFLMFAALTAAQVPMRAAGATKNVLAAVMNASAVAIFVFSPDVHWDCALAGCTGGMLGGFLGGMILNRISERLLKLFVIVIGIALTIGLFLRAR